MAGKINGWYGWRPDKPDIRDFRLAAPKAAVELEPLADLRSGFPDCYDQGNLGSCTANAIAAALEFDQRKQKEPNEFMPSRLFIYYNERAMEGTIGEDAGAEIRDGIKSVATLGAPPETLWPYIENRFKRKPSKAVCATAVKHKSLLYERVEQTLTAIRACLAGGLPVVFGFTCYESFESDAVAKSGILSLPALNEKAVGGHAVVLTGYDDQAATFMVRNSWGKDWGQQGYFTMPYAYVTNGDLCDDFWVIRSVQ